MKFLSAYLRRSNRDVSTNREVLLRFRNFCANVRLSVEITILSTFDYLCAICRTESNQIQWMDDGFILLRVITACLCNGNLLRVSEFRFFFFLTIQFVIFMYRVIRTKLYLLETG